MPAIPSRSFYSSGSDGLDRDHTSLARNGRPLERHARTGRSKNDLVPHSAPVCAGFVVRRHRAFLLLSLLALLAQSLIFEPIGWWFLSFVCLVPWLLLIGGGDHAPRVYLYSYALGLAFFLLNMRWLAWATVPGYIGLSIYLAAYFPLIACPVRHAIRRRRLPLGLVVPLIWTGSEMLRAVVISGFPWFFLSHSLAPVLTLIQVSDLVGAYGVSFVIAAVNGAIADVVLAGIGAHRARNRRKPKPAAHVRQAWCSGIFATALLVGVSVYGQIQLRRDTSSDGPKVAVIQGDYLSLVGGDEEDDRTKMGHYLEMLEAASKQQPDLYLLPETPWIMYLNRDARGFFSLSQASFGFLQEHAVRHNAYLVTGSASLVFTPYDLLARQRRYNSATVFTPDGSEPERYDKVHLVPFGEKVPFRFGRLRFLYLWLNRVMPFSGPDGEDEYSLFPGEGFKVFSMEAPSQGGSSYRFGIPICYEDVMPYVSREFVTGARPEERADFLLNISNDGWFGRGTQQPQHLAVCVFRAVENRVGIARAVNTGVSGFIKPSGQVHDLVQGDPAGRWPGNSGYAVAHVGVDSRHTLYSRHGDWFAWACALTWLLFYVDYWMSRVRATHD